MTTAPHRAVQRSDRYDRCRGKGSFPGIVSTAQYTMGCLDHSDRIVEVMCDRSNRQVDEFDPGSVAAGTDVSPCAIFPFVGCRGTRYWLTYRRTEVMFVRVLGSHFLAQRLISTLGIFEKIVPPASWTSRGKFSRGGLWLASPLPKLFHTRR